MNDNLPIYSTTVSKEDLDEVKSRLSKEQLEDIGRKVKAITGCIIFSSYETCLLAERMMEYGLLAAHVEPRVELRNEFEEVTIEKSHIVFGQRCLEDITDVEDVEVRSSKHLIGLDYHMRLINTLKHSHIGGILAGALIRIPSTIDPTVPDGEVWFLVDSVVCYKIKGVKHAQA